MNEQLPIARRHVVSAKRLVASQEQRLLQLQARRSDTTMAYRLLVRYRKSLTLTEADCALLEASAGSNKPDGQ
jgi:hypothetical protein